MNDIATHVLLLLEYKTLTYGSVCNCVKYPDSYTEEIRVEIPKNIFYKKGVPLALCELKMLFSDDVEFENEEYDQDLEYKGNGFCKICHKLVVHCEKCEIVSGTTQ